MIPNVRTIIRTYWTAGIYIIAHGITQAFYQADTVLYVRSVQAFEAGDHGQFLELGHILWRPIGWIIFQLIQFLPSELVGTDAFHQIATSFFILTWIAGFFAVVILIKLLRLLNISQQTTNITSIFLILSNAFLNFSQTGSAYVPGFTLVLLALYFSIRAEVLPQVRTKSIIFSGISLGLAICIWIPYLWSVPGVLAFGLLYSGFTKRRFLASLKIGIIALSMILLVYGSIFALYSIDPITAFTEWNAKYRAMLQQVTGISRVVVGLGKSFLNIGNDAVDLKRFLLNDPYNEVTYGDLFIRVLWKYVVFYGMIAALVVSLITSKQSRKMLFVLLFGSIPMIYFASTFDGAANERYFPLLPFFIVTLAWAFEFNGSKRRPIFRFTFLVLLLAMVVVNIHAMYSERIDSERSRVEYETQALASYVKPHSRLFTIQSIPISKFKYEVHKNVDHVPQLIIDGIIGLNAAKSISWKQGFAIKVDSVWQAGGIALLPSEFLSAKPKAESEWVEKQDPRISWSDIFEFFRQFETRSPEEDIPFVLLYPTPGNRHLIDSIKALQ